VEVHFRWREGAPIELVAGSKLKGPPVCWGWLLLTLEFRLPLSARELGIVPHRLAANVFDRKKKWMPSGQRTAAGEETDPGCGTAT